MVDNIKRYGRQTREAQCVRCCRRDVDDPAAHERSTIVDSDDDRPASVLMGDAHQCSKWQSFVGSGHVARFGDLAIRRLAPRIG